MDAPKAKRARKPNFSTDEVAILLQEIAQDKILLLSSLTNEITNKKKQEKWAYIAKKVSTCGVAARSVDDIRDKWKNLKSDTLKRIEDQKKTGGGPPKKPAPFEDLVLAILGEKSAVVHGINASVPDVFATSRWQTSQPEFQLVIEQNILDSSMGLTTGPQVSTIQGHQTELDGASGQLYDLANMPDGNILIHQETEHPAPTDGALSVSLNETAQLDEAPTPHLASTPRPHELKKKKRVRRQKSGDTKGATALTDEEKHYFESQIEINKMLCNVLPALGNYLEGQQKIAGLQEQVLMLQARKLELEIEEMERK